MLIVALTGGIATGKSIVADVLKELGCYIHNADKIAHQLMEPGQPAWDKITRNFGKEILNLDGTVNREKLASLVFSSKKARKFLNALLHPLVFEKKKETIAKLEKEGHCKIFISEAALTVEAGFTEFFDKVVVVHCDTEKQIQRLMERDKISRSQALQKIQSQLPQKEKLKYADYKIDTSGSLQNTVEQSERLFRNLMMDFSLKQESGNY